jgi:hypothetical protein
MILQDADDRDEVSDARDVTADDREGAASLAAFLSHEPDGSQLEVRRAAALDRLHSKTDRASAADDRGELARSIDETSRDADAAGDPGNDGPAT